MTAAPTTAAPPAAPVTDAGRLAQILQQVEAGTAPDEREVARLAQSPDRATRGLAKRYLAVLRLGAARREAARLLAEACEDLDFRYPIVFDEAVQHAAAIDDLDRLFELRTAAARSAAARDDLVAALVHLSNAAAVDFRNGARRVNDPASLRSMIACYEAVAAAAAQRLDVPPVPRARRRSPPGEPLRLAHVVCQLVDGGHSPTRATWTLLKHADPAAFKTFLFVTDALAPYSAHAGQTLSGGWTSERGAHTIQKIETELGVPVVLPRTRASCVAAAADLHQRMRELAIDVAFFHGSIATPVDWLLCAWRCAPWQFDRAFGVPLHCPAVDFQFFEFQETMEPLAFWCRERAVPYGFSPFGGIDLSHVAAAKPLDRAALGIPAEHVILGTVGNHLPRRMSPEFCVVVAGALRARPQSTYLVVGEGDFHAQQAAFGSELCSSGRVRFTGPTSASDRLSRTLDIYLNEFPAGGGAAVLEAMAAEKPVVCMGSFETSLAAAGATYVGEELTVRPPDAAAYARRLIELIDSPERRVREGARLRARYESEFNGLKWVRHLEQRVRDVILESSVAGL